MSPALHELVGKPSGDKHSEDAAHDFSRGNDSSGSGSLHALELGEESCSPVKNREPYNINAEVRNGKNPDERVPEHKRTHNLLIAFFGKLLMRLCRWLATIFLSLNLFKLR